MTGCMTEMGIENNWAILGKQRQSWGEVHPWGIQVSSHGLAHHQGSAVCLCRRKNCANEEMQRGRKKLEEEIAVEDWKEKIAEK